MSLTGAVVNALAIAGGGAIGLLFRRGIPERVSKTVMVGLGLCVLYIGISGASACRSILIVIVSMTLGAAVGALLNIDGSIHRLGTWVEAHVHRHEGGPSLAEGFVTASLLCCIGAMAVNGSLDAGIRGDNSILFTKSMIDLVFCAMMATTLGAGVMLAGAAVLVVEGTLTLLAGAIAPLLSEAAVADLTCAGSLLVAAIGLNQTGATKIKVADYLPALLFVPVIRWACRSGSSLPRCSEEYHLNRKKHPAHEGASLCIQIRSARMRPRPGRIRPKSDTSGPTTNADTTVPMPTPCSRRKNSSDSADAMTMSVTSNTSFTRPKSLPVACASTRTSPSPGTVMTSGAISMLMPQARMAQPSSMHPPRASHPAGCSQLSAAMLTSRKALKSTFAAICSSCTGGKFRRWMAIWIRINTVFIIKVKPPKLSGKRRLSTYGRLEICDVPRPLFVMKAMPNELMSRPSVKKR